MKAPCTRVYIEMKIINFRSLEDDEEMKKMLII